MSATPRRSAATPPSQPTRGSTYNYLGKFKEAVADYDKALALGYSFPVPRETGMANLGRGYALLYLDQYQRALDDFDAVLKVVRHAIHDPECDASEQYKKHQ